MPKQATKLNQMRAICKNAALKYILFSTFGILIMCREPLFFPSIIQHGIEAFVRIPMF